MKAIGGQFLGLFYATMYPEQLSEIMQQLGSR